MTARLNSLWKPHTIFDCSGTMWSTSHSMPVAAFRRCFSAYASCSTSSNSSRSKTRNAALSDARRLAPCICAFNRTLSVRYVRPVDCLHPQEIVWPCVSVRPATIVRFPHAHAHSHLMLPFPSPGLDARATTTIKPNSRPVKSINIAVARARTDSLCRHPHDRVFPIIRLLPRTDLKAPQSHAQCHIDIGTLP